MIVGGAAHEFVTGLSKAAFEGDGLPSIRSSLNRCRLLVIICIDQMTYLCGLIVKQQDSYDIGDLKVGVGELLYELIVLLVKLNQVQLDPTELGGLCRLRYDCAQSPVFLRGILPFQANLRLHIWLLLMLGHFFLFLIII